MKKDFTARQKIIIALRYIKTVISELLCQHQERPFASKTRGNVIQRLGGKMTAEEHERYIEEASKKIKLL